MSNYTPANNNENSVVDETAIKSYTIENNDADWVLRFVGLMEMLGMCGRIIAKDAPKYKLQCYSDVEGLELLKKIEALNLQYLHQTKANKENQKFVFKTTNSSLVEALVALANKIKVDCVCDKDIVWGHRIEIHGHGESIEDFEKILKLLKLI